MKCTLNETASHVRFRPSIAVFGYNWVIVNANGVLLVAVLTVAVGLRALLQPKEKKQQLCLSDAQLLLQNWQVILSKVYPNNKGLLRFIKGLITTFNR